MQIVLHRIHLNQAISKGAYLKNKHWDAFIAFGAPLDIFNALGDRLDVPYFLEQLRFQ